MEEILKKQPASLAEKIALLPIKEDSLQEYEARMLQKAFHIFGNFIGQDEKSSLNKAQFAYKLADSAPSMMTLYLLTPNSSSNCARTFFEEMTKNWLCLKQQIRILSSQEICFSSYYFLELVIYLRDTQQLNLIKERLPSFAQEIKKGALSTLSGNQMLRLKHLSLETKNALVYSNAQFLSDRFPKKFDADFFKTLENFLLNTRTAFQEKRSVRHLCRIICTFYLFQKSIFHASRAHPLRRHLNLKLFPSKIHYPFGLKEVLSIVVSINILSEYEKFSHKHILHALRRIFPAIECHRDSFYHHRDEQMPLKTLYLEIEKKEGVQFTLDEIIHLNKHLAHELKNSIEHLSPSLFIPRNEEELMRNIIALSHELKYVRDLPQAIISFQEQKGNLLRFNVVLLRLLHKNSLSLQTLAHHLPSSMRFLFERVSQVGYVRKKHIKEANIFTLEVKNSLFFRDNHSVDLVRARQFISHALEKMVGKFRDYNGGLLLKQNQRLEAIKKLLPEYRKQYEYLFENLFYSLSPPMMQASLPLEEGSSLFSLVLRALHTPLSQPDAALLSHLQTEQSIAIVIKTSESQIKDQIARSVLRLEFGAMKFTKGSLTIEDNSYLCYLLLDSSKEKQSALLALLTHEIEAWRKQQQRMQILRFHLPRATQALDPRIATDRTSGAVVKLLYEGLTSIDSSGKVQLALAEKVIQSKDKKSYTFFLKKSFWSNQEAVTAYDFEYAWKSTLDPSFSSPYSFLFFVIKNAEKAKRGTVPLSEVAITPLSAQELHVELEHPSPYFLHLIASPLFSPLWHEIDKKYPGWAHYSEKQYVCNGPFKLAIWKVNNDLTLTKNTLYWQSEKVKLDKVFIQIIENEQTALDMFLRKELDWMGDPLSKIPIAQREKLYQQKQLCHDRNDSIFLFQLNVYSPPFQSKKIRQAFAYAVNREELLKKFPLFGDQPARSLLGEEILFPDSAEEEALSLFEEGLEELGLSRNEISPIRISHSEIEEHELLTHAVGTIWEELFNIEITYERLLWNTFFEKLLHSDYMIGGLAWFKRYDDPTYLFDLLSQSSDATIENVWQNPDYLSYVAWAKRSSDPHEQHSLLSEAEKILIEEVPIIPILKQKFVYIKNNRLKNVFLSHPTIIDFTNAYLSQTDEEEKI